MDKKIKRLAITTIICVLVASIFGTVMVLAPPDFIFPELIDVFVTNTSDDPVPVDVSGWLHTTESGWNYTEIRQIGKTIALIETKGYRQISIGFVSFDTDAHFDLYWLIPHGTTFPDSWVGIEQLDTTANHLVHYIYDVKGESLQVSVVGHGVGSASIRYYLTT